MDGNSYIKYETNERYEFFFFITHIQEDNTEKIEIFHMIHCALSRG